MLDVIDLFDRCPECSDSFQFAGELLGQALHANGLEVDYAHGP